MICTQIGFCFDIQNNLCTKHFLSLYSQSWLSGTFWSPQTSSLKSKVPYFKHLTKEPYSVYLMKDQGKMAISFGINTFINKNIIFFVINHRYGFKKFSYNHKFYGHFLVQNPKISPKSLQSPLFLPIFKI